MEQITTTIETKHPKQQLYNTQEEISKCNALWNIQSKEQDKESIETITSILFTLINKDWPTYSGDSNSPIHYQQIFARDIKELQKIILKSSTRANSDFYSLFLSTQS